MATMNLDIPRTASSVGARRTMAAAMAGISVALSSQEKVSRLDLFGSCLLGALDTSLNVKAYQSCAVWTFQLGAGCLQPPPPPSKRSIHGLTLHIRGLNHSKWESIQKKIIQKHYSLTPICRLRSLR